MNKSNRSCKDIIKSVILLSFLIVSSAYADRDFYDGQAQANYYKNYSKAVSHFKKSLQYRIRKYKANHWKISQIYNLLGHAYYKNLQFKLAISALEKELYIEKQTKHFNGSSILSSDIFGRLGDAHRGAKNFKTAIRYYRKSLDHLVKRKGKNHPYEASICVNIADTYQIRKRRKMAKKYYKQALAVEKESGELAKSTITRIKKYLSQ